MAMLTIAATFFQARRLTGALVLLALLAVAASSANNLWQLHQLARNYPPPGKMVEVDGHAMHLYCIGTGTPTVVLESGLGSGWLQWQTVQPELARTTRVCAYDRAGLGWSDMRPGARDARHIAAELHALLLQAGESAPLVLVGASAGGLYVRQFFASYPAEVVGLVLADASLPEQVRALPHAEYTEDKRSQQHRQAWWTWFKEASGWSRLSGQCEGDLEPGMQAYANQARAEACRPSYALSWLGEWDEFWHSAEQAAQAPCCGDRPLLVISQDPDRPKPGWSAEAVAVQPIWNGLQEGLKRLSPHSRRIIARNARHHVMADRPDVVISGTRQLVLDIRRHAAPDGANGSTVVQ
jgi:pimeloyl-ACP methyl ester carboxylesterase